MKHAIRRAPGNRRGVVLLVVISLLMLFAIVGIAFVIYAEAQASTARIWKEGESLRRPDIDPELLLAHFLGQLIYDTDNPASALRAHSLGRGIYGPPGGATPFDGTGRAHTNGQDDYYQIDYTDYGNGPRNPDQYGKPNVGWHGGDPRQQPGEAADAYAGQTAAQWAEYLKSDDHALRSEGTQALATEH